MQLWIYTGSRYNWVKMVNGIQMLYDTAPH